MKKTDIVLCIFGLLFLLQFGFLFYLISNNIHINRYELITVGKNKDKLYILDKKRGKVSKIVTLSSFDEDLFLKRLEFKKPQKKEDGICLLSKENIESIINKLDKNSLFYDIERDVLIERYNKCETDNKLQKTNFAIKGAELENAKAKPNASNIKSAKTKSDALYQELLETK